MLNVNVKQQLNSIQTILSKQLESTGLWQVDRRVLLHEANKDSWFYRWKMNGKGTVPITIPLKHGLIRLISNSFLSYKGAVQGVFFYVCWIESGKTVKVIPIL